AGPLPDAAIAGPATPIPGPKAAQLRPSPLALFVAAVPPAVVKKPAAYKSLPDTASENTCGKSSPLLIPEPKADQLLPFHLAMLVAALPPAVVKSPPAYRSLPDTASADTNWFIPEPKADQPMPSHLAMLVAALPPAVVNL